MVRSSEGFVLCSGVAYCISGVMYCSVWYCDVYVMLSRAQHCKVELCKGSAGWPSVQFGICEVTCSLVSFRERMNGAQCAPYFFIFHMYIIIQMK